MKRFAILLLALLMCLSLCACGAKDTPAATASQKNDETITIYAQAPADWTAPGCWAWSSIDSTDAFDAWPGEAMSKDGNWYTIEVPNWVNYVIINGNAGSVQTADLSVDVGKDVWVVVEGSGNANVFYEEPAADEISAQMEHISPEELFASVGTLDAAQITDSKVLTYVYQLENGVELSREIDLSLLPGEVTATAPEEVRYIVHCTYIASQASRYIGNLMVFNTSVRVEFQDVLSGDILAAETFQGAKLPESITSNTGKYYADYPDEAKIVEWITQQIQAAYDAEMAENEARMEKALSLAKTLIDESCFSYSGLIEALTDEETCGYTYEEAVYAANNCGADWFEEAAESAERYVGWGMEERGMLIQSLKEDGFTHEQAVYGAENYGD